MMHKKYAGHVALLIANIIFGLNNPISRSLTPEFISPYTLTFFRIGGATLLFWLASLFVKKENVPPRDILLFFLAAIFAISANQVPFIVGLSMTSPIDASIVVTMLPILSMVFAAMILREPITLIKTVGVIVGASGALLLIFSSQNGQVGSGNFHGNLVVFSAVISFALYLTLFKQLISRYSPVTSMKWLFLFATFQSYPFCHRALMATNFNAFDHSMWLRIAYVVAAATFFSYILLAIGQKALRPTTLSMYNYVQPVVASLAAVFMGLDQFGVEKVISGVLVFAGVYVVTQSKSRAQVVAEKAGIQPDADDVGN